jgi:hypothetical protein
MTTLARILTSAALVVAAAGCDSATTETDQTALGGGCTGNVDIQVSFVPTFAPTGKTPVFDWTSHCGVAFLVVQTVPSMGAAPVQMWGISAPENRPLRPAIAYGVLPRGATLQSAGRTLVQGVTYKIVVTQTVGGDVLTAHGERTFIVP